MVECYLCKGKLRVTRDKHVFDEKLKKRYHFKCFAGICRVCDMPVYTKGKHKVIGSNVWHEKCYKTKHRHNPATEEGVNKKLRQLSEEVGKLKIGRHPGKKGAATEEGVTRKLHQLADELDKMHLGRKNPNRPTKEFWAKHYPGILKEARTKFKSEKRAEEYARGATAQIWHHTMGPKKKAKYEGVRRKREARENPPKDIERFEKELVETLDTTFLIYETGGLPATKSVTLMSMRPVPVAESTYSIADTPEHRKILSNLGVKYTVLKISPEHAKLLIKEMLRRDLVRKNPTLPHTDKAEWEGRLREQLKTAKTTLESINQENFKEKAWGFVEQIQSAYTAAIGAWRKDIADKLRKIEYDLRDATKKEGVWRLGWAREELDDIVGEVGRSYPEESEESNEEEPLYNPKGTQLDYIIQDEFGTTFETGKGTEEQAEARALHYNQKHMRQFKVIYPKRESPEVKKAAQTAAKEMLKS